MSTVGGDEPDDEYPFLDLNRPVGDARIMAAFRTGLQPDEGRPFDFRNVERRAVRRYRQRQTLKQVSAAVAAAAVVVAVMVMSPWAHDTQGTPDQGTPARPTTTTTTVPSVTQTSLLQLDDLVDENESILGTEPLVPEHESPEDYSGQELSAEICMYGSYGQVTPSRAWGMGWVTDTENLPESTYRVSETLAQWPGDPEAAAATLDELRAAADDCASGLGDPSDSFVDVRTQDRDMSLPHVAVSSTVLQGLPQAQVYAVAGDTLIAVTVTIPPSGTEDEAYSGAMNVLDAAIARLTGQTTSTGGGESR